MIASALRECYNGIMTCSIAKCQKSGKIVFGYCTRHYQQIKHHGKITDTRSSRFERRHAIIEGNIAKIPLGADGAQGFTIVDANMAHLDSKQWYRNAHGYAATGGGKNALLLHRAVVGAPDGLDVDHKNRNRLDNRSDNLRACSRTDNTHNRSGGKSNTGYKGVCYDKTRDKYIASINQRHIGRYATAEEAALVYNEKAKELHGKYAVLNDIQLRPTTPVTRSAA